MFLKGGLYYFDFVSLLVENHFDGIILIVIMTMFIKTKNQREKYVEKKLVLLPFL